MADQFPHLSDADVEAELHRTKSQIAALRGGGAARGRAAGMDWSFVKASACRPDNLLGEGAGCVGVYKLVSPATGEPFAVKLIKRSTVGFGDAKHSFEKEVAILNALRHPGVCRLRHVTSDSKYHMLAIELCDEGELFNEVAKGGLKEDVARGYFCQVVSALGYCHSKGVFHRDLKLENVLVKKGGVIKVADFGMAKHCGPNSACETRQVGTVAYMAPEVADAGQHGAYDGALVDVWSCGVMLYVMVVCNYPFGHDGPGGQGVRQLLRNIASGRFSFPSRLDLSPEIKDLIGQMLTVDVRRRITIAQIKQHPWAAPGMAAAEAALEDSPVDLGSLTSGGPVEAEPEPAADDGFGEDGFQ